MSDGNAERGERVGQKRAANEEDIASKMLVIQFKRFYVDVKQNSRGRFIKIAEMGNNHKSRIVLSMSAAVAIRDKIDELVKYSKENPAVEGEDKELKSEMLNFDTRRYYLDLKQNARGRFLRIAQTLSVPHMSRSQVVIPGSGMEELLGALKELIEQHSEGYLDHQVPASALPESKTVKGENGKMFYFDSGSNERGNFIRITELKQVSGFRTSITVPAGSLGKFRDAINELIDKFESGDAKNDSGIATDEKAAVME